MRLNSNLILAVPHLVEIRSTWMWPSWKPLCSFTFNHLFELLEEDLLGHFSPWRARRSLWARRTRRTRWARLGEKGHIEYYHAVYHTAVQENISRGGQSSLYMNISNKYLNTDKGKARHAVTMVVTRGRLRLRHFPGKLSTGLLTKSIHEPSGSTLCVSTCSGDQRNDVWSRK